MPKNKPTNSYDASSIQVLEGLDPVRKRPGMYIGSTGVSGLHHLIWEVVDNAVDEAIGGYATDAVVILEKDGQVTVIDNGRGIPVDVHKQTKKSALETVMTTLHAGGKFGDGAYKVSGGLHGVGVSVVNALSSQLVAVVKRDNKYYFQEYSRGKAKGTVKQIKESDLKAKDLPKIDYKGGTAIRFMPDGEIFETLEFDRETIMDHLRQQAFLTGGLKIIFIDRRDTEKKNGLDNLLQGETFTFYFQSGVKAYLQHLMSHKKSLTDVVAFKDKVDDLEVEVGLAYSSDFNEHIYTFANNIHTIEGGMHLTGFRSALTRVISDFNRKNQEGGVAGKQNGNGNGKGKAKKEAGITGEDVREGLVAVISVKLPEPQFEGQTKAKLGNPEARTVVENVVNSKLSTFLEENPKTAKMVLEKVLLAAKARMAAKAAKDTVLRKGLLDGFALPGKLSDCASRNPEDSELFLVEGNSAGGNAKQARDSHFQAILPLRGKVLNVEKTRFDKALKNEEIRTMIMAMGMGVGDEKDITKIRYHRIIIMADADVDGSHICTLLLTLFFRFFPEIIGKGYLYIAQSPLFKIKSGKETIYAFSEAERDAAVKQFEGKKVDIQRYKGLGEMNPDQLWNTTMDPDKRLMLKVTVDDAEEADQLFSTLMGEEVSERKKFIQHKASQVQNLDI
ncbi:MAG: DNA gyrase subunit B [Patescibacteria group bacterium]|nr:DNA gyrase subunit B [Patescibacteria group bacterium]